MYQSHQPIINRLRKPLKLRIIDFIRNNPNSTCRDIEKKLKLKYRNRNLRDVLRQLTKDGILTVSLNLADYDHDQCKYYNMVKVK